MQRRSRHAGRFGGTWTPDTVWGLGLNTLIMEKAFNRTAGFTPQDDRLPQFFYDEASPMTGAKWMAALRAPAKNIEL